MSLENPDIYRYSFRSRLAKLFGILVIFSSSLVLQDIVKPIQAQTTEEDLEEINNIIKENRSKIDDTIQDKSSDQEKLLELIKDKERIEIPKEKAIRNTFFFKESIQKDNENNKSEIISETYVVLDTRKTNGEKGEGLVAYLFPDPIPLAHSTISFEKALLDRLIQQIPPNKLNSKDLFDAHGLTIKIDLNLPEKIHRVPTNSLLPSLAKIAIKSILKDSGIKRSKKKKLWKFFKCLEYNSSIEIFLGIDEATVIRVHNSKSETKEKVLRDPVMRQAFKSGLQKKSQATFDVLSQDFLDQLKNPLTEVPDPYTDQSIF